MIGLFLGNIYLIFFANSLFSFSLSFLYPPIEDKNQSKTYPPGLGNWPTCGGLNPTFEGGKRRRGANWGGALGKFPKRGETFFGKGESSKNKLPYPRGKKKNPSGKTPFKPLWAPLWRGAFGAAKPLASIGLRGAAGLPAEKPPPSGGGTTAVSPRSLAEP